MGDFGSTKQKTKSDPPPWYSGAALEALGKFSDIAKMGYIPYQGMDVAGLTGPTQNAIGQAAEWSSAFMNPGATPGAAGQAAIAALPQQVVDPTTGISGFRSFPGMQAEMGRLESAYPGLAAYLKTFFMDPVTGKGGDFWDTKVPSNKTLKKLKKKGGTIG